jgi:nicotinamidase-related amidase
MTDPHPAPRWETSALVTIDMQRDFLSGQPYGLAGTTEIVPSLRSLAGAFRAAGRPIVHIVRLYQGDDVDRVRRTLIDGGGQLATDAISQASEQGFREVAGIGVVLAPTAEIVARLTAMR